MFKPEIDAVLARNLGRVAAPEELWGKIEESQVSAGVPARHAPRMRALLVLATLLVLGVVVHKYSMPSGVSGVARPSQALNTACALCHAGG